MRKKQTLFAQTFDTSQFQRLLHYDDGKEMRLKNLDLTLARSFSISEQAKVELRMETYNAPNNFNGALPNSTSGNSALGAIPDQLPRYLGRQFEYSGRLTC